MVSIIDRVRGANTPEPVDPEPESFEEMTLQEHLLELRNRLVYSAIAVAVGFVVGLIFSFRMLDLIERLSGVGKLKALDPMESFVATMKVALYIGIGLAMPILIYQIVRFLAPGLTRNEKRYLYRAIPFVFGMFVLGVLFAFFIVIPRGLRFLHGFGGGTFEADFRASSVVSFYLTLLLWVGIVFELPVVMYILAKLHVVTAQMLGGIRKYALILIMIAAAIITPTPDPFNMFLIAAPMYLLYELGILLARFA
ncbi:MAG TPA: twin-arginine translocase subunit TatC [Nitrolancea sp.]|nr:twin-arginine translocase subunit TatC [Nitrolancea sp.]